MRGEGRACLSSGCSRAVRSDTQQAGRMALEVRGVWGQRTCMRILVGSLSSSVTENELFHLSGLRFHLYFLFF